MIFIFCHGIFSSSSFLNRSQASETDNRRVAVAGTGGLKPVHSGSHPVMLFEIHFFSSDHHFQTSRRPREKGDWESSVLALHYAVTAYIGNFAVTSHIFLRLIKLHYSTEHSFLFRKGCNIKFSFLGDPSGS